jgi:hypothetical protein
MRTLDVLDFFQRIRRLKSGCWKWTGPRQPRKTCPYGLYSQMRAHRFSWEWFNNRDVPEGMCVLHKCDNSLCVNPAHLHLGTHEMNMAEMHERDRHWAVRGEAVFNSVLTEAQVRGIKKKLRAGVPAVKLAVEYRINPTAISCIKLGKTWRHVR